LSGHQGASGVRYLENAGPIAVGTCYCRPGAELLDENDACGKPNDVCMQFGTGARFAIERGPAREISKNEQPGRLRGSARLAGDNDKEGHRR